MLTSRCVFSARTLNSKVKLARAARMTPFNARRTRYIVARRGSRSAHERRNGRAELPAADIVNEHCVTANELQ